MTLQQIFYALGAISPLIFVSGYFFGYALRTSMDSKRIKRLHAQLAELEDENAALRARTGGGRREQPL